MKYERITYTRTIYKWQLYINEKGKLIKNSKKEIEMENIGGEF